jgi:hypothetical protein
MKQSILYLILLFYSFGIYAQNEKYHRVKIVAGDTSIESILDLGIQINFQDANNNYLLELSDFELNLLKHSDIPYEIVIRDLESFYSKRNAGKNPDQILESFKARDDFSVPENFTLGSMGGFCTYSEIMAHLDTMHAKFPHLISARDTLGQSLLERPVYWLRISDNPNIDEEEPEVFYNALIHAREPGSMQQMLYYMHYILENYNSDPEIKLLVDNTEMYFVPCINPDGYIYNEQNSPGGGGMWRKNRRTNYNNSKGVDLNRNFSYQWGYDDIGSSPSPVSSLYRGEAPFSEPETILLKNFAEAHDFTIVMNYHTYGNIVAHSWGYSNSESAPDYDQLREISTRLTQYNQYEFGPTSKTIYLANGDATDWFYGEDISKSRSLAFTPEVGTQQDGFWPPIERIIPQCQDCLEMNLTAAKLAGTYSKLYDLSDANINLPQGFLKFGIKRIGATDAPVSINIEPLGEVFEFLESEKTFNVLPSMEMIFDSVYYKLKPGIIPGDKIQYLLTVDYGNFISSDTICKISGTEIIVFDEPCNTSDNWTTNGWALRDNNFHSPSNSLSNVSGSFYPNNSQSEIHIIDTFNIVPSQDIWVRYFAMWDLDGGRDYIKFVVSYDYGQTWQSLPGRYTSEVYLDGEFQHVYQGNSDEWLAESILLDNKNMTALMFGFQFESDAKIGRSGFYFDDFQLCTIDAQSQEQTIQITKGWSGISAYLNPKNPNLGELFSDNLEHLEFLTNENSYYQTDNSSSTMTNWESRYGYLVKSRQNFSLTISGYPDNIRYLDLHQGWNLIPVNTEQKIEVSTLVTEPENQILVIKEACNIKTYWPGEGLQSLKYLEPGKSYYIKLAGDATLFMDN